MMRLFQCDFPAIVGLRTHPLCRRAHIPERGRYAQMYTGLALTRLAALDSIFSPSRG